VNIAHVSPTPGETWGTRLTTSYNRVLKDEQYL
jgi:hypothetical protein